MKCDKRKLFTAVIGLVFLVVTIMIVQYVSRNNKPYIATLDTEWNISVDGAEYENVTLSHFSFASVERGDQVVLTRTLPDTGNNHIALQFREKHSVVHIYVDDEEIFRYGTQYEQDHVMVGSGYVWAELPMDCAGQELRIVLDARENGAFNKITAPYLLKAMDVNYSLIIDNLLTAVIAVALLVFGWMAVAVALVMYLRYKKVAMLAWIGTFAMLVSVYLLCYSRLAQILVNDLHRIGEVEYICLYFTLMCLIFFLYEMYEDGRYRLQLRWTGIIFFSGGVLLVILNAARIRDFTETLEFFQIFGLIMVLFLTGLSISWARTHRLPADRTGVIGIIILIAFVIADLIRYQIDKYGPQNLDLRQSLLPIGFLAFVLCMFLGYTYRMMENVEANIEKKTLLQMAYTDTLTNINNRAYCEEEMTRYEVSKDRVSIINMDLNKFKEVNDTYGHAVGDELLIRFAQILDNVFEGIGCVGRMGGDEFIVIMKYREKYQIERIMQELLARVEEANHNSNRPYTISVAYGIADNSGNPEETARKVYERADKEMYRYKQQYKENGGYGL